MTRVCYWCNKHIGEKEDNSKDGVFHSICDRCANDIRLDERLPELLWAIVNLRKQNSNEQYQQLGAPAPTQYATEAVITS